MSLPNILTSAATTNAYDQYVTQTKLVEDRDWCCCANCFSLEEFVCKRNNLPIPPKVAVVGCGMWDGLPF